MSAVTASGGSLRRRVLGRQPIGYAFVAPYLLFLALIFAYPLGLAVWMSFRDYFFAAPGASVDRPFIGLDNYREALSDEAFRRSLLNVVEFLVINVPLTVLLAMVLATALNGAIPFRTFFRTAYYLPYLSASVAVISVWLWLFSSDGLVNAALGGLAPDPSWLVNETWTMPLIALHVTWKQLGFFVLLYLAALQNIPRELYEAAEVDGAGTVQRFRSVTVPGVRLATALVVILSIITGANLFSEPYLLTGGGGPDNASISPVLLIYREAIEQNHPGYASAIGVMLTIGVMLLALVNRWVLERD